MKLVIDIPEKLYEKSNSNYNSLDGVDAIIAIRHGTPFGILDNGTLFVPVDDRSKVKRVLIQDKNACGGMFYAISN